MSLKSIASTALIVLTLSAHLCFALPPKVEADRQILAAESAITAENGDAALTALDAARATGAKMPASFPFLNGRALLLSGQFDKAKEQLELYLSTVKPSDKNYKAALSALNGVDEGKRKLADDQAMLTAKKTAAAKVDLAWKDQQTSYFRINATGNDLCPTVINYIKGLSKTARSISCSCKSQRVQHPAWRDYDEDYCVAKWQRNTLLDNNDGISSGEKGPNIEQGLPSWGYTTK
jgi:hypothetical protein